VSDGTTGSDLTGPRIRDFLVPDLGEGLEEATVVEWAVPLGETVDLNAPLCVLETAKATVDIPSPFAGRLVERRGTEGDTLAVGSLLARIQTGVTEGRTPTLVGYGVDTEQDRSRRAPGAGGTAARVAPEATRPVREAGSPGAARGRPMAKPPVRRLARSLGVDLATITPGSGVRGIVTRDDVLAAGSRDGRAAPATGPSRADTVVPVRGIRARVAERMTLSRGRIPDATCGVTVDCGALLDLRGRLSDAARRAGAEPVVTPFALIARLLVQSLTVHPALNSTFVDDGPSIRVHGDIHLGIGTATDRGLLVVVVREAQKLTTLRLAEEIARLAAAARAGTAAPAELTGSTFTVSNFGALGLDEGVPVINYPEAAILGIGSVKPRPVVRDGAIVARPTAALTLAFDHRVGDGAEAGALLGELTRLIEDPGLALLRS
jgi:2-oxoisovalerate dehydrogenase E2 component (dihydrolipoyl transacylase)